MKIKPIIALLVWSAAVFFIVRAFDIHLEFEPYSIAYVLLALVLTRVLWAWNWYLINRELKLAKKFLTMFKSTFVLGFTDLVTPTFLPGAELASAYYLKQRLRIPLKKSLPPIFMQTTVGLFSQISVLAGACLYAGLNYSGLSWLLYPGIILALVVLVVLTSMLFGGRMFSRFIHLVLGRMKLVNNVVEETLRLMSDRKLLTIHTFATFCITMLIEATAIYFIILRGGAPINFVLIVFAFLASYLISLLSFIPGGLGIQEASLFAILEEIRVPVGVGATAVILYRVIFFWVTMLVGGYLLGTEVEEAVSKHMARKKQAS
jgi:uncharacterized protein (TIRG00374 family)